MFSHAVAGMRVSSIANHFSPLVFFAILCGFAGDVFLLGKEKSWPFAAGLVSFAIGHVLYAAYMWKQFLPIPNLPLFLIYAALILCGTAAIFRLLYPRMPKVLFGPCLVYMLDIGFMSLSALMYSIRISSPVGWLAFIGSLLFILSDTALSISTFRMRIPGRYLIVMSTYILAQVLLVVSFALTGGVIG